MFGRWIVNLAHLAAISSEVTDRFRGGSIYSGSSLTRMALGRFPKIYLTAERPDVAAVVEEVNLQCFNCVNSLAHWQIITESENIRSPEVDLALKAIRK